MPGNWKLPMITLVTAQSPREFDPSDYGNRSILGPPFRIMDEDPTDLWGWIVNIISATGAIVGILGIFVIIFEVMGL